MATTKDLDECIESAEFWTKHINEHAIHMQSVSDGYAIASSIVSSVTGLGVWAIITQSTDLWARIVVGTISLAAAYVAIVQKVRGYSECAIKASPLSGRYAKVLSPLRGARAKLNSNPNDSITQAEANKARDEFDAIREIKQSLNPFPKKLQRERDEEKKRTGGVP